jgi:hypothetical protein
MISHPLTFVILRSTVSRSSTVATARPGEAFFLPRGPDSRFCSSQFILTRLRFVHNNFRRQQSVKRTYDPPYMIRTRPWSQGRYFALNPVLFPHGLDNKYVDRRSGKYRCEHLSREGRFAQSMFFWCSEFLLRSQKERMI